MICSKHPNSKEIDVFFMGTLIRNTCKECADELMNDSILQDLHAKMEKLHKEYEELSKKDKK